MKPLVTLDRVVLPDGRELALRRRDGDYTIEIDRLQLMSTRSHGSESELAEVGCAALQGRGRPRVLVGGLGLGFTLRQLLRRLPADAEVVVLELFEAVVQWNREYLADPDDPLADPRVRLRVGDVVEEITAAPGGYDAILLDVDNGPSAWTVDSNDRLYDASGSARLFAALAPGGTLALWSAGPDEGYARRLANVGFEVSEVRARARRRKGARHTIFVARRPRVVSS